MSAPETVRVLVALDIPAAQATDENDLLRAIEARVEGEAGYLDVDGGPVTPTGVVAAIVPVDADDTENEPLTAQRLQGIYEVGAGF